MKGYVRTSGAGAGTFRPHNMVSQQVKYFANSVRRDNTQSSTQRNLSQQRRTTSRSQDRNSGVDLRVQRSQSNIQQQQQQKQQNIAAVQQSRQTPTASNGLQRNKTSSGSMGLPRPPPKTPTANYNRAALNSMTQSSILGDLSQNQGAATTPLVGIASAKVPLPPQQLTKSNSFAPRSQPNWHPTPTSAANSQLKKQKSLGIGGRRPNSVTAGSHSVDRVATPVTSGCPIKSKKSATTYTIDESQFEDKDVSFRVCVRIRPLLTREVSHVPTYARRSNSIIQTYGPQSKHLLRVHDSDLMYDHLGVRDRQFAFHEVFNDQKTNKEVFQSTVQPLLAQLKQGYNATCFAYGMTGAGKTYTMFGYSGGKQNSRKVHHQTAELGIANLAVEELFKDTDDDGTLVGKSTITVNFLEIYNEQVKDLLSVNPADGQSLAILEDPTRGMIVQDLCEYEIEGAEDLKNLIKIGNERRTVAATGANQTSSRSHAILILNILTEHQEESGQVYQTVSKLQIVDLAGSERAQSSDNRGQRMIEGANINKSLLALGNCINALSDPKRTANPSSFVCYRDSKLTRLLKDSLGGNTKTVMLACISQFYAAYEETLNTLKYAQRACQIKNIVCKNMIRPQATYIEEAQQQLAATEATMKQHDAQHQVEMQQNRTLIHQYGTVIQQLQGQVSHLQDQLTRQQQVGSQQDQNTSSIKLAEKAPKQSVSQQPKLSQDELLMYNCFKGIIKVSDDDDVDDDGQQSSSQTLKDFFANIHEKVTQNVEEKHLLAQQSEELKATLTRYKHQISQLEKSLGNKGDESQEHQGHLAVQMRQMKLNERQLLCQNVETNSHLLTQVEDAARVNSQQFHHLRSYLTGKLPILLQKVIQKVAVDNQQRQETGQDQSAKIVAELENENAKKDQEIADLKSVVAKLQAERDLMAKQKKLEQEVQNQRVQVHQQASNHQQNNQGVSAERSRSSQKRNSVLGRYLSAQRERPTGAYDVQPNTFRAAAASRSIQQHSHSTLNRLSETVMEPSIMTTTQQSESQQNLETIKLQTQPSQEEIIVKTRRSTSRQKYINAVATTTPVSRVNLNKGNSAIVIAQDSAEKQSQGQLSQQAAKKTPKGVPIKEFRSYAKVRQESKQRQVDSHRSLEKERRTVSPSVTAVAAVDNRINLAPLQSRNTPHQAPASENEKLNVTTTSEKLNSIENELRRHREVEKERMVAQKNRELFAQQQYKTATTTTMTMQQPGSHDRVNSAHFKSATCQGPPGAFNTNGVGTQTFDNESLEATDRKLATKHLNLSSVPATCLNSGAKLENTRALAQSLKGGFGVKRGVPYHDSEEDEMTQMSCGMNIRETFREAADDNDDHFKIFNATQEVCKKKDRSDELVLIEQAVSASCRQEESQLLASRRVQEQLQSLGVTESFDELDFFTQRESQRDDPQKINGPSRINNRRFEEKIHEGDYCLPNESDDCGLTTPKRAECEDTTMKQQYQQQNTRYMRELVQPSEPSEMMSQNAATVNENQMTDRKNERHYRNDNFTYQLRSPDAAGADTLLSARSDILTCNLQSQNGSPRINQDAVRQLLGHHQRMTPMMNQLDKKNVVQNRIQILDSPLSSSAKSVAQQQSNGGVTNRTDKARPIQVFPQTTTHQEQAAEASQCAPNWTQVLDDESTSVILAFGEDICQENDSFVPNQAGVHNRTQSKEVTDRTIRVTHHSIRKGSLGGYSSPQTVNASAMKHLDLC